MYIKKRFRKNILNILFSIIFLFWFWFLIITADEYNIEEKSYLVNAAFFEIKERQNNWYIPLNDIIISDENLKKFTYFIQQGDTLSSISSKFWTSISNIKKINNLKSDVIKPWNSLIISEEEWIIYEVKNRIKLNEFADKYKIDIEKTKELNYISDNNAYLEQWDEVFLPIDIQYAMNVWLIPKPVIKKVNKWIVKSKTVYDDVEQENNINYTYTKWQSIISKRYYKPTIYNWFYQWHCTRYVAIKKFPYLTKTKQKKLWSWNAWKWYSNAKSNWYKTWTSPKIGSIVVLKYWWRYFYGYWHVGIVQDIDWKNKKILIEDMNAVWRFVVTKRWIPMDWRITWYIHI